MVEKLTLAAFFVEAVDGKVFEHQRDKLFP